MSKRFILPILVSNTMTAMMSSFITTLVIFPAFAQNQLSDMPSQIMDFSTMTSHLGQMETELEKSIFADANPNTGNFTTQISIPLGANAVGLNNLNLKYSHQRTTNQGMGIGWDWDLPRIEKKSGLAASPYVFVSSSGAIELYPSRGGINALRTLVSQLTGLSDPTLESYRAGIDEDGTIYVLAKEEGTSYWLSLSPSGKRILFTGEGRPLRIYNRQNNFIKLTWSEGLLTRVEDSEEQWVLQFNYQTEKLKLPSFRYGEWNQAPKGLLNATIKSKLTDNSKTINFSYDGEYLISAIYDGGIQPFARFEYADYKPYLKSESTNDLIKDDKRVLIKDQDPEGKFIIPEDNVVYMDLNGDHISDRIIYSRKRYDDQLKALANEHFWDKSNDSVNYDVDIYVEFAFAEGPGLPIKYIRDNSINIVELLHSSNLRIMETYTAPLCNPVSRQVGTIDFMDINGDNLLDLVYYPIDHKADYKKVKNEYSQWLFNQANNGPSNQSFTSDPIFKPHIWILETNFMKIKSKWNSTKNSSIDLLNPNVLFGVYEFRWIDVGSLKINHFSRPFDLGNGLKAWYVGNQLQIIAGTDPITKSLILKTINYPFYQLIDHTNQPVFSALLDSPNMARIITTGGGKINIASIFTENHKLNSSTLSLLKPGKTFDIQLGFPTKVMSSSYSPYGGKIEVKYKFESGILVLDTLTTKPISNPTILERYDYKSLVFDSFRGTWMGFSRTNVELKTSSNLVDAKITENSFFFDLGPDVILYASRGSLTGRPISVKTRDSQNRLRKSIVYEPPILIETGDGRLYNLPSTQEIRIFDKKTDSYTNRKRTSSDIKTWIRGDDGTILMPESMKISTVGNGLRSAHNDGLLDGHITESTKFEFIPELYILNPSSVSSANMNGKKSQPDETMMYDRNGVFLKKSCKGDRCDFFKYDDIGRLIKVESSNGDWETFSYESKSPLISQRKNSDSVVKYKWDLPFMKPKSIQTSLGLDLSFNYTIDGITKEVNAVRNNVQAKLFEYKNLGRNQYISRQFQVQVLDRSEVWRVDGFGRLQEKLIWRNGRWTSTGFYEMLGSNILQRWDDLDDKPSRILAFQQKMDVLNKPINIWRKGEGNWSFENEGNCNKRTLNNIKTIGSCFSSLGNILSQQIGSERVSIDTLSDGSVLGVPTLGITYGTSELNEITSNQSLGAGGSVPWEKLTREIDPQGLWTRSSDGFFTQNDSKGRVIKTKNKKRLAGLLEENFTFFEGLPKTTEANYGSANIYKFSNDFDSLGNITNSEGSVMGVSFKRKNEYDQFGRLRSEFVDSGGQTFNIKYKYIQGEVDSVSSWINKIRRDAKNNITKVIYTNGSILERDFEPGTHWLKSVRMVNKHGQSLYAEKFTYNSIGQISRRTIESTLNKNVENFSYDSGNYQLLTSSQQMNPHFERNHRGEAVLINGKYFFYSNGHLIDTTNLDILTGLNGEGRVFCQRKKDRTMVLDKTCTVKLSSNEFLIKGLYVRRVQIEGLTLGIWLNGEFFPTVVDQLGSVKAVSHPSGNFLYFTREYGPWGEKTSYYSKANEKSANQSKALDLMVVWSYADLHTVPFYELTRKSGDPELYWSASRVYSPQIREWLTVDPLVQWSPEELTKKPGNWNATRYANNDPVNYFDPKGTEWQSVFIGAAIGGGFAAATGYFSGLRGTELKQAAAMGAVFGGVGALSPNVFFTTGLGVGSYAAMQGLKGEKFTTEGFARAFVVSLLGHYIGSVSKDYLMIPTKIIGNSIDDITKSMAISNSILSTFFGGIASGIFDPAIEKMNVEFKNAFTSDDQLSDTSSYNETLDAITESFDDPFENSWWYDQ